MMNRLLRICLALPILELSRPLSHRRHDPCNGGVTRAVKLS